MGLVISQDNGRDFLRVFESIPSLIEKCAHVLRKRETERREERDSLPQDRSFSYLQGRYVNTFRTKNSTRILLKK
jgi:hypothetical protein